MLGFLKRSRYRSFCEFEGPGLPSATGYASRMRANVKRVAAVIVLAPVLFWTLATGMDFAQRDPEALEMPLGYLAITWLLYLPVFCVVGLGVIAGGRFFRFGSRIAPWVGAAGGASLAVLGLSVAAAAYSLPLRAWRLCLLVGAVMGALLLRIGQTHSSQSAPME